jgi:dipeptidyl aminopeptidase/acylaminoacyl peptidase
VAGGVPRQVTRDGNNERPRWTPDSKRIVFSSTRTGGSQLWSMDPDGASPRQLTSISTEASGHTLSPNGKKLVFLSSVYPECAAAPAFDDACNKVKLDAESKSKVKARTYTSLLYRHWTEWQSKRRSHLFSIDFEGANLKDLTPGDRDVPPFSLGDPDGYAISPDSTEVAYVANVESNLATSTNSDIFVISIGGGESKQITGASPGADNAPLYSPDGKWLIYRSQERAGFESDRWRLILLERATGKARELTENLDRPVSSMAWSPDSTRIFFVAEDRGRHNLQMISVNGGGLRAIITGSSSLDDVQFTRDGKTLIYTEQSGSRPTEIFRASSAGGIPVPLTRINDQTLVQYALSPFEEFWVEGAEGARIHSFLVKPPGFTANRKYPVLFLIHGGPQGAWGESWTWRWNAQVFASAGFLVIMPNPRGSTGYGQKFTDEISGDWGGKAFSDIMAVVDHIAVQPYADAGRMAAAGGSYGGYMVNWMLGHTDRFKAFVSHAGVFDLRSMAGETEELWFPLWEFRGMPWKDPELYAKWSPSYFAGNFKTPTLVIHGEQDFRVPYGQGLQLFTSLQMQKVPSKLLVYPDEGHWIQKPQNTLLWYNTFIDWINEWTRTAK